MRIRKTSRGERDVGNGRDSGRARRPLSHRGDRISRVILAKAGTQGSKHRWYSPGFPLGAGMTILDALALPSHLAALHNPAHSRRVPDAPFDRTGPLAQELLELTSSTTARAEEDPFGNPVLLVALAISRRIEAGTLDDLAIGALIGHLRDAAFADRARRVADYVGGTEMQGNTSPVTETAQLPRAQLHGKRSSVICRLPLGTMSRSGPW